MTADSVPAPFARYEGVVLPEWIDSNGHMNLAYYVVLFDMGVEALFAVVGFGPNHDATTRHGPFAVETHTIYERELLAGERVRVASRIVGLDAKRLHLAHEMFRLPDGQRAAMQEVMYLHVDLAARRAVPFTPALRARLDSAYAAHAALPIPDWVGRRVAMPERRAG
jgi:acyl-CoA thioester hydrolase